MQEFFLHKRKFSFIFFSGGSHALSSGEKPGLPAHDIGHGVGHLAHAAESSAHHALHALVSFGPHSHCGKAADHDAHTHAHVEILLVHFLVSLCLTYFAYFVCELIMCVNGVD